MSDRNFLLIMVCILIFTPMSSTRYKKTKIVLLSMMEMIIYKQKK